MQSSRVTTITDGEITFIDDQQTKQFKEIYIHTSSKWVKTITKLQGKEVERWFPIRRIFEIRKTKLGE